MKFSESVERLVVGGRMQQHKKEILYQKNGEKIEQKM